MDYQVRKNVFSLSFLLEYAANIWVGARSV